MYIFFYRSVDSSDTLFSNSNGYSFQTTPETPEQVSSLAINQKNMPKIPFINMLSQFYINSNIKYFWPPVYSICGLYCTKYTVSTMVQGYEQTMCVHVCAYLKAAGSCGNFL